MMQQIKSKTRVKDFAEVYTAEREVKAMCNLIPKWTIGKKVLEPACGNGNFLVEILQRKLKLCNTPEDVKKAVQSIYAVDLLPDNVVEAKKRLWSLLSESGIDFDKIEIAVILNCNIQQGDFLTMKKKNGAALQFVKWESL